MFGRKLKPLGLVVALFWTLEVHAQSTESEQPQPPAAEEVAPARDEPLVKRDEPVLRAEPKPTVPGPVAAPAAAALPAFLDWVRYVKLGGGAILYYYQPLKKGWDNNLSFYHVRADVDVNVDAFGLHLEPRFRDTKLRAFFEAPVWLEEAYASWTFNSFATLRVGKTYSRLGLFWDNSFYGNIQCYDGLKLAPDYGASLQGGFGDRIGLNYWAQFFLVDGSTNVSLVNRDTASQLGRGQRRAFREVRRGWLAESRLVRSAPRRGSARGQTIGAAFGCAHQAHGGRARHLG
jgi:hypothetical protein